MTGEHTFWRPWHQRKSLGVEPRTGKLAAERRSHARRRRRWLRVVGVLVGLLCLLAVLVAATPLQSTLTQAVLLGPDSLLPASSPATVVLHRGRRAVTVPVQHGRVLSGTIASPALGGRHEPYLIYLPPGYGDRANAARRYSVLYLLHGAPGQPSDWINGLHVDLLADTLIAQGRLRPLIMVMPDGNGGVWKDSQYINRYGGTFNAATYITRDAVHFIDTHFRTITRRGARAIAGISEGGYGAMNLGLRFRDEFGTAISVSGYFRANPAEVFGGNNPFGGNMRLMARNSPLRYAPTLRHGPRVNILIMDSTQDGGYTQDARRFAARLHQLGIPYTLRLRPAPNPLVAHYWPYFRQAAPHILLFAGDHFTTPTSR